MRHLLTCIAALLLAGCNAAYRAPTIERHPVDVAVQAPKDHLYAATMKTLAKEGLPIASSDKDAGVISTSPKQMRLDETDVDLGTTLGIPYIKDSRTVTKVAYTIVVEDNRLTLSTAIQGEYLPNDPAFGKTMDGVSTGKLERELGEKIKAGL